MTPNELAKLFHETYERLAPEFGYATRKETAIPWEDIPEDNANKQLMWAVAGEVLQHLPGRDGYLKRIADALEAGNKLVEASNKINNDHVELQIEWRLENLAIEKRNQKRQDDWFKWNQEQKSTEYEQALKLQQEFNEAMLAKYETQLREQLRENALLSPVPPTVRLVENGDILLCDKEE